MAIKKAEKNVYQKLNDFKKLVGKVKKDGANPFHKSKYATIESVLETIEAPLETAGLGFIQSVDGMELITVIYDTDNVEGKDIVSKIPLLLSKQDMQQLGSAITYARRYALVTMFGLEQADDDANYASGYKANYQAPVKNHTKEEISGLSEVKGIEEAKICSAYGVKTFAEMNQQTINTVHAQLLKK